MFELCDFLLRGFDSISHWTDLADRNTYKIQRTLYISKMKLTIFAKHPIFDALQCFEYACEISWFFHFPVVAGLCSRLATVKMWASKIRNSVVFKDERAFVQNYNFSNNYDENVNIVQVKLCRVYFLSPCNK